MFDGDMLGPAFCRFSVALNANRTILVDVHDFFFFADAATGTERRRQLAENLPLAKTMLSIFASEQFSRNMDISRIAVTIVYLSFSFVANTTIAVV